jgi:hypothetical protein
MECFRDAESTKAVGVFDLRGLTAVEGQADDKYKGKSRLDVVAEENPKVGVFVNY